MHFFKRIVAAAVLGGGTYAGLIIFKPELGAPIIIGVSAATALVGIAFGIKAWEAIVHLF